MFHHRNEYLVNAYNSGLTHRRCNERQELRQLCGFIWRADSVSISPDDALIATRSRGETSIWRGEQPHELIWSRPSAGTHAPLAWAGNRRLATTDDEKTIVILDTQSEQIVQRLVHVAPVQKMAFTPDGRYLAAAGTTLVVWDVPAGKVVHEFPNVYAEVIAARDRNLFAAASGAEISLIDLSADTPQVSTIATSGSDINSLAISGHTLAACFASQAGASLWDLRTGQLLMQMDCDGQASRSVGFSPDGRTLVLLGEPHHIRPNLRNDQTHAIWEWTIRKP
jgi:WD40 repeat protein